jgi:VanZ family protein
MRPDINISQLRDDQPFRRSPWGWRGVVWLVYFAAWTYALVTPIPPDPSAGLKVLASYKLLIAKTLHVVAYAVLAGLSGWLRVPCRFRWILLFVIMAHAPATELIQLQVEGRSGELLDVGWDHLGIGLGLLLTWKWWSDPR